jgi:hypothetical protein
MLQAKAEEQRSLYPSLLRLPSLILHDEEITIEAAPLLLDNCWLLSLRAV